MLAIGEEPGGAEGEAGGTEGGGEMKTVQLPDEVLELVDYGASARGQSGPEYLIRLVAEDHLSFCRLCRDANPTFWMVPNRVWRHYLKPPDRNGVLCLKCWTAIVQERDGASYQNHYGKPRILDLAASRLIDLADIERGLKRFPSPRNTLIGFRSEDWRLISETLTEAIRLGYSKAKRLADLVHLIQYQLRNRPRYAKAKREERKAAAEGPKGITCSHGHGPGDFEFPRPEEAE